MGWGIEGYIELNPDWKENLEAIAEAAAADEAADTDEAGGVWPGVAGDPRDGMVVSWCRDPPPLAPPPFADSEPFDVKPSFAAPLPDAVDSPPIASPEVPPGPLAPLVDEPALLCELPLSRFWFRSFSSRLHLARRLENQTCKLMCKTWLGNDRLLNLLLGWWWWRCIILPALWKFDYCRK